MSYVAPGVCRHCGCTGDNACSLYNGDTCAWIDRTRTVCSAPACIRAEADRVGRARAAIVENRLISRQVVRDMRKNNARARRKASRLRAQKRRAA